MFIRLNLRQHFQLQLSAKWPNQLFHECKHRRAVTLVKRHYGDIKRNEELLFSNQSGGGNVIPTPLKIKQTIKSGFYDFVDGFTCIQTSCPVCPSAAASNSNSNANVNPDKKSTTDQVTKKDDKCLFVNKTTGSY